MGDLVLAHTYPSGRKLEIAQGDIIEEDVDAIVNAANARLKHGGGLARVIARRGGREIQEESDAWVREHGPVPHDSPAHTSAGKLPFRYIIHAVGPKWGSGEEDAKLAAAVVGSLTRADELHLRSIALPAISTGIFGFPPERAAGVIFRAIARYFDDHPGSGLERVRLTLYDRPTLDVFRKVWDRRFGGPQIAEG